MSSIKFRLLGFSILLLLGACACTQGAHEARVIESGAHKFPKPGAGVKLISPPIIHVEPNQIVLPELVLAIDDPEGQLHVVLSVTEGLELIDTPEQLDFPLAARKRVQLPLKLRAIRDGRFYVHLQTSIRDGDSVSYRNVALIIQSGAESSKSNRVQKQSEGSVISMPAKETIAPR